MGSLLDEPAAVLVMVSLAALLLVVEAALPTVGIAGTLGLVLSAGAIAGVERQDATWWPLLGPAVAVVVWCVMVARRDRPVVGQAAAALLFGGGGITFGVMADSAVTAVLGAVAATILAADFPWLHGAARRLLERPTQVGMDSMLGTTVEVVHWDGLTGTVRSEGSLWNATSTQPFMPGDHVTVVSFAGTTLHVAPPDAPPPDVSTKESPWKP